MNRFPAMTTVARIVAQLVDAMGRWVAAVLPGSAFIYI